MKLRDYQQECHDEIEKAGPGSWLIVMPTGSGKTATFTHLPRKGKVLIIAHTRELVEQPKSYFDEPVGVEMANQTSNGEDIIVASIQSLRTRKEKFSPDYFDSLIVDEAQHSASKTYSEVLSYFKPRQLLGFTATPNRADNIGLDTVFDKIIFERDLKWAIESGFLSNISCRRIDLKIDLASITKNLGDYSQKALDKTMNIQGMNEKVAKVVIEEATKHCIVFCVTVEHAENVAKLLPDSEVIVGKTKDRSEKLQRFKDGKTKYLVTVGVLTEGVDLPICDSIVIARPTRSIGLYTQMVGRCIRKYEGKTHGLIIDLVGNTKDNDLCTASSLLGYTAEGIPNSMLEELEGDIFDMPDILEKVYNTPEVYLLNDKMVDLFRRKHKVSMRDLFFIAMPDGELILPLSRGKWIGIEPIDSLGYTKVITNMGVNTGERRKAQEVIDRIFVYIRDRTDEKMSYLRKSNKSGQKKKDASAAQKRMCQNLLKRHNKYFNTDNITMYEASTLISRLKANKVGERDGRK